MEIKCEVVDGLVNTITKSQFQQLEIVIYVVRSQTRSTYKKIRRFKANLRKQVGHIPDGKFVVYDAFKESFEDFKYKYLNDQPVYSFRIV